MSQATVGQKRIRRYFGKIREVLEMPKLIEVQKSSYDLFLKSGDGPKAADGEGIQGAVSYTHLDVYKRQLKT